MFHFDFSVNSRFTFRNICEWGKSLKEGFTTHVCVKDASENGVIHFDIPDGLGQTFVSVYLDPYEFNFQFPKEQILRGLFSCEISDDDDKDRVDDFFQHLNQVVPKLSFVGDIWVNPVVAVYNHFGRLESTRIKKGRKMSWGTLLSKYKSLALWGRRRFYSYYELDGKEIDFEEMTKISVTDAAYDRLKTIKPLGCLILPENKNSLPQPVTNQQVYVVGNGLWRLREDIDPSDIEWVNPDDRYLAIEELEDVWLDVPKNPALV